MRNVLTIFRKEMRSYFTSPVAYVLLALFTFIFGFLFIGRVHDAVQSGIQMQFMQQGASNVNEEVIHPLLGLLAFFSLLFIPLITMRLFSEEKRSGTIELLATSPVRDTEIILGKWLAAVAFYGCLVLACSLNMIFLFFYSHPDWKVMLSGYLGLFLLMSCMLAIGTFISSLTRSQIIAAISTLVICVFLWVIEIAAEISTGSLSGVYTYLSLIGHLDPFLKGVLAIKDVVFYASLIFFSLFLTARYLESLRWRS